MHSTLIRRMAARWVLGLAQPQEVVEQAHYLLEAGVRSNSLSELAAIAPNWAMWTFEQLYQATLHELGCEKPDEKTAMMTCVAEQLERVYEQRCPPRDALTALSRIDWNELDRLAALADCNDLIHAFWDWTDLREWEVWGSEEMDRRALDLDMRLVSVSELWLLKHHQHAIRPNERAANVAALAEAINAERAFDRLPILADALEDAGCTNADVLEHCRQPAEHARACWVVDLLLGKG